MILLLICFILEILVISSVALKSQLEDAFSDPNWMNKEERKNSMYIKSLVVDVNVYLNVTKEIPR